MVTLLNHSADINYFVIDVDSLRSDHFFQNSRQNFKSISITIGSRLSFLFWEVGSPPLPHSLSYSFPSNLFQMSELQTFRRSYIPPLPSILTKDVKIKNCEALGAASDHGTYQFDVCNGDRENPGSFPQHLRTSSCGIRALRK